MIICALFSGFIKFSTSLLVSWSTIQKSECDGFSSLTTGCSSTVLNTLTGCTVFSLVQRGGAFSTLSVSATSLSWRRTWGSPCSSVWHHLFLLSHWSAFRYNTFSQAASLFVTGQSVKGLSVSVSVSYYSLCFIDSHIAFILSQSLRFLCASFASLSFWLSVRQSV